MEKNIFTFLHFMDSLVPQFSDACRIITGIGTLDAEPISNNSRVCGLVLFTIIKFYGPTA